ncbi:MULTISPECIES: GNAT family N-acetyltransferase [unclassified Microbacterium]|uniref:GNAT family N-acetyltransferase n=1 Tax=Microbacterium TaxID=33882 RepID=UPI003BA1933C
MRDPLDSVAWPVRTERLIVRRAAEADVDALWRHRRLPEVSQWITTGPETLDDFRTIMTDPAKLAVTLIIERADDGEVVGDLMLRVEDAWSQRELTAPARGAQASLGWTLHPAYGGRGYATEAVRAAIDLCFGPIGVRRVLAACFADNEPSWRLMERIGMRREEHSLKSSLHRSGEWLDGFTYALLAEEWPTVRPPVQSAP